MAAGIALLVVIFTFVLAAVAPGFGNSVYAVNTAAGSAAQASVATAPPAESISASVMLQRDDPAYTADFAVPPQDTAQASAPSPSPATSVSSAPSASGTGALVPGCHDAKIIDIQTRLMELDYMDSDQPTDYYGWSTKYSLELFQRKNGLQIDGLARQQTLSTLFSQTALPYTVSQGDRGYDIKSLQQRLIKLNYLKSNATGVFDANTANAVKEFQKRNGLNSDGIVGEQTNDVVFAQEAKPAPAPSVPAKKPAPVKPKPAAVASPKPSPAPSQPVPKPSAAPPAAAAPSASAPAGNANSSFVDKLISVARSLLGSRYVRGGKGPHTFDCSGFVYYCLNKAGYKIDYMVSTDWAHCSLPKISSMSAMQAGDIICYSPHHVALYIGGSQMIDASSSNGKVVIRSCDTSYWHSHFICARRVS